MVDADRVELRLERLGVLIDQLDDVQAGPVPESYAEVFTTLQKQGLIPDDLALSLAAAAGQRSLLAHLYLEIDDRKVFESLSNLDRLRQFGAFVEEQLD